MQLHGFEFTFIGQENFSSSSAIAAAVATASAAAVAAAAVVYRDGSCTRPLRRGGVDRFQLVQTDRWILITLDMPQMIRRWMHFSLQCRGVCLLCVGRTYGTHSARIAPW